MGDSQLHCVYSNYVKMYTVIVENLCLMRQTEGANPQRVSTEIITEIKQFNPGRMASHASIESIYSVPTEG